MPYTRHLCETLYVKEIKKKDIIIIPNFSEMKHPTERQNFLKIFGC